MNLHPNARCNYNVTGLGITLIYDMVLRCAGTIKPAEFGPVQQVLYSLS